VLLFLVVIGEWIIYIDKKKTVSEKGSIFGFLRRNKIIFEVEGEVLLKNK